MPRLLPRQDPLPPHDGHLVTDPETDPWAGLDGLIVDGIDPTALHRARIRALNTRRQQEEAARTHGNAVTRAERERLRTLRTAQDALARRLMDRLLMEATDPTRKDARA